MEKSRKIRMAKKYYICVSYQAGLDYGIIQNEIEDLLGSSDGSGYGFGGRDLTWNFNNIRSLKSAIRKVRSLPRRIKCQAWEITNEEYDDIDDYKEISLRNVR